MVAEPTGGPRGCRAVRVGLRLPGSAPLRPRRRASSEHLRAGTKPAAHGRTARRGPARGAGREARAARPATARAPRCFYGRPRRGLAAVAATLRCHAVSAARATPEPRGTLGCGCHVVRPLTARLHLTPAEGRRRLPARGGAGPRGCQGVEPPAPFRRAARGTRAPAFTARVGRGALTFTERGSACPPRTRGDAAGRALSRPRAAPFGARNRARPPRPRSVRPGRRLSPRALRRAASAPPAPSRSAIPRRPAGRGVRGGQCRRQGAALARGPGEPPARGGAAAGSAH